MKRFFRCLKQKINVLGGLTAFVVFILSFLWWMFDANTLVPMWLFCTLIIVCYLICVVVYSLCSMKETSVYRLPAIRKIEKVNDRYIFIVEKNDLFNQGSYSTICYQEDDNSLEIVIGLGYVQTINSAGYMQVQFENISSAKVVSELYPKIRDSAFYRKAIKIKPSIDKKLLEEVITNG